MGLWSWFTGKKNDVISSISQRRGSTHEISTQAVRQEIHNANLIVLKWLSHSVEVGRRSEKQGVRELEKIFTIAIDSVERARNQLLAVAQQNNSQVLRKTIQNLSREYENITTLLNTVRKGKYPQETWNRLSAIQTEITAIEKRVQTQGKIMASPDNSEALKIYNRNLPPIRDAFRIKLVYIRQHFSKEVLTDPEKARLLLQERRLQSDYNDFLQAKALVQGLSRAVDGYFVEEEPCFRSVIAGVKGRIRGTVTSRQLSNYITATLRVFGEQEDTPPAAVAA